MRGVFGAVMLVLAACGLSMPTPAEIPVGGVRTPITRDNLVAARTSIGVINCRRRD